MHILISITVKPKQQWIRQCFTVQPWCESLACLPEPPISVGRQSAPLQSDRPGRHPVSHRHTDELLSAASFRDQPRHGDILSVLAPTIWPGPGGCRASHSISVKQCFYPNTKEGTRLLMKFAFLSQIINLSRDWKHHRQIMYTSQLFKVGNSTKLI